MATQTMTIRPYKGAQWEEVNPIFYPPGSASWRDLTLDPSKKTGILVGGEGNSSIIVHNSYGSVGINIPRFSSGMVVSSVKLNITTNRTGSSFIGTLKIKLFNYSSSSDGRTYRAQPDFSQALFGSSAVSIDLNPSIVNAYSSNFGIFMDISPSTEYDSYNSSTTLFTSLVITYESYEALPPDTLSPNAVNQDPRSPILLSWLYRETGMPGDYQTESEIDCVNNEGFGISTVVDGNINVLEIPAEFFQIGNIVTWKVRAKSALLGYSGWSETAKFSLAGTPPEKPIPYFPIGIVVKINEIVLEWKYQSLFDTSPSRFDLQYKVDAEPWIEILFATSGETTYKLTGITTSSKIEWQVKAYGASGYESEWSDIVSFHTAGKPPLPSIIAVTNSAHPIVKWGAIDLQVWEIEVMKNDAVIYSSGSTVFDGITEFKVKAFLDDGQYVCRLRVKNKHDVYSDWAERAFNVITVKPTAPSLQVIDNPEYAITLRFDNPTGTTLVYRAEIGSNNYLCVYKTTEQLFHDFSIIPDRKYKYFVRAVDSNDNFADSNIDVGYTSFYETTLASVGDLSNMFLLKVSANSNPSKSVSIGRNKTFLNYIGRQYPVAEVHSFKSKVLSFTFFIPEKEYIYFEELAFSETPSLIRDKNIGKAYGFISGDISLNYTDLKGYIVSFSFIKIDYDEEILID